jgi:hypothetical protein
MNYAILINELQVDPLGRGYSSLTDVQVVASLLARNIATERTVIPSYEVIEATVPAEWAALTAAEKQRYQTLTGAGQINLKGANTRAMLGAMFGAGTTTRANLAALQAGEPISRAEQLGIPDVADGHVASARQQMGG